MSAGGVLFEEGEAGHAVKLGHVAGEFVAAAEDAVELVVTETYDAVVLDCAAVVDLADVGPHAGAEAHVAGLSGGVELAARKVEGAEHLACLADGIHLTVTGGVVVKEYAVVAAGNHLSVLYYNRSEGAAVMVGYAFTGLVDGHLHESVLCLHD